MHTCEPFRKDVVPLHLVKVVVAECWGRLRRLAFVPFHPQRIAALRTLRELADRSWGVEIMFEDPEFANALMIR